ncbi:MAG TPA: hypothetical protein PLA19_00050 [Candidatus Pacearchaeota archaeon]|nr:hypothetical protein [Candidatus Pacearchaeota archaeon]
MRVENIATSLENNPEYQKRLEKWEETEEYFSGSGNKDAEDFDFDGFDGPFYEEGSWIDKKIKELVVGLNLIGVETNFSCEGHLGNVGRVLSRARIDDYGDEYLEQVENPPLEGNWSNPYVGFILLPKRIFARTEKGQRKLDRKEYMAVTKLQSLIDEFYQERGDDLPEVRVRLKEHESRYSDYEIVCSDAEETKSISGSDDYDELKRLATKRLELEQRDIEEFSEFLKKKYLETGFHL